MKIDLKKIHIGELIEKGVAESGIQMSRICSFLKCNENDVKEMYNAKKLDTELLLRWSKLLEYDFFRLYSQHLILYSSNSTVQKRVGERKKTTLPEFRKNIYTKEILDFILEMIESGEKTKQQVIEEYRIPKTTLYKWIGKYRN